MKFDGKTLKDGSKTVANVRGDKIYEGSSMSKCLANLRGDKIYEGSSMSKTLCKSKMLIKRLVVEVQAELSKWRFGLQ